MPAERIDECDGRTHRDRVVGIGGEDFDSIADADPQRNVGQIVNARVASITASGPGPAGFGSPSNPPCRPEKQRLNHVTASSSSTGGVGAESIGTRMSRSWSHESHSMCPTRIGGGRWPSGDSARLRHCSGVNESTRSVVVTPAAENWSMSSGIGVVKVAVTRSSVDDDGSNPSNIVKGGTRVARVPERERPEPVDHDEMADHLAHVPSVQRVGRSQSARAKSRSSDSNRRDGCATVRRRSRNRGRS